MASLDIIFMKFIKRKHMSITVNKLKENISSLTPNNNCEENQLYIDLLEDGIENRDDTRNIALTGPYGAGKSTILNAYKKHNQGKGKDGRIILNISMASFDGMVNKHDGKVRTPVVPGDNTSITTDKEKIYTDIKTIEKTILQQMFYSASDKQLPLSKFSRISNIDKSSINSQTLEIITFALSFVLLYIVFDIEQSFENFKYGTWIHLALLSIVLLLSVFLSFRNISGLYYQLKKLNLNKISFKGLELLFSSKYESVLNGNIDEILYFFESTKTDVVIIEDLDRFDSAEIFVNLRELNNQINSSSQVEQTVTFIYAVREDIFKNEDRVKFFDLIIPIIPFINSENSHQMINKKIKAAGLQKHFNKSFIYDISLFISDMRLLTNIINEFLIYYTKLLNKSEERTKEQQHESHEEINLEKLFSIIIYKNFHPDDFAKLHKREGDLFQLMKEDTKQAFIKDKIKKIDDKKEVKAKRIDAANENIFEDKKELRKLLLMQLLHDYIKNTNSYFSKVMVNTELKTIDDIVKDEELFIELENKDNTSLYNAHNQIMDRSFNISVALTNAKNNINFNERVESLIDRSNIKQNSIKNEIKALNEEKQNLQNTKIGDLVKENGFSTLIPKTIKESDILYYLVTNNYIDSDYSSFISLVHDLSEVELTFLRRIKNYKTNNPIEKLLNTESIVSKLSKEDFSKIGILNIHLVDYIISSSTTYEEELKNIINQLDEDNDTIKDFIYLFITSETLVVGKFVKMLADVRGNLWDELSAVYIKDAFDERNWLNLILKHIDTKKIQEMESKTSSIEEFISEMPDFIEFVDKNSIRPKKVEEYIRTTDLKIKSLDKITKEHREDIRGLFEFICFNNHYRINKDNLRAIVTYYTGENVPDADVVSYQWLSSSKELKIMNYIDDQISEYIKNVYMQVEHQESVESIKAIIDNPLLEKRLRAKVVEDIDIIFDDIEFVENMSWSELLWYKKIKPTWENVLKFYEFCDKSITNDLTEYLNDSDVCSELKDKSLISVEGYNDEEGANFLRDFRRELYFESNLTNENIVNYKSTSPKCWPSLKLPEMDFEKLKTIVTSGYLCTNPDNFNYLKANPVNKEHLHIILLEQKFEQYLKHKDEYRLTPDDIEILLNSSKIDNESKRNLIHYNGIDIITFKVPFDLLKYYLSFMSISKYEENIKLVTNQMDYLNKSEAIGLVSQLDDKYKKITTNKQFEVEYNDLNYELASSLQKKGFIKDAVPLGGHSTGRLRIRTIKDKK